MKDLKSLKISNLSEKSVNKLSSEAVSKNKQSTFFLCKLTTSLKFLCSVPPKAGDNSPGFSPLVITNHYCPIKN